MQNQELARFDFSGREISPLVKQLFKEAAVIKDEVKCLDLGCGDGAMLVDLYEQGLINKKMQVTGIDISVGNIAMCKTRLSGIYFLVGDAENTQFPDNYFNIIYSWMVIEHVNNPEKMVAETMRLLKRGGKGYVSSIVKVPWAIYIYRNNHKFVLDPTHINEFTSETDFLKLFKENGAKIISFNKKARVYSIFELCLKLLIKLGVLRPGREFRSVFRRNKVISFLRKILVVPVPGFYQVEVLYEKSNF